MHDGIILHGTIERGTSARDERPTFLLIDDDTMVGRFIGHAAEECGYRAIRTSSFDSFVENFRRGAPVSVAVDLCVPGCDGVDIIRFLAEEKYPGMVLIISGLDPRIIESALRLGMALGLTMAEPLPKPFRLDHLARRLEAKTEKATT